MKVETVPSIDNSFKTSPESLLKGYKGYFQLLGVDIFNSPSPIFRTYVVDGFDSSVSYQAVRYSGRDMEHLQASVGGAFIEIVSVREPVDEISFVRFSKRDKDGVFITKEGEAAIQQADQLLIHKRCLLEEQLSTQRCFDRLFGK